MNQKRMSVPRRNRARSLVTLLFLLAGVGGCGQGGESAEVGEAASALGSGNLCWLVQRQAGQSGVVADANVYVAHPTTNYGGQQTVLAGLLNDRGERNALLRFDLSGLQVAAGTSFTVTSGALLLVESGNGANAGEGTVEVHRLLGSWSESTVTWANAPAFDPVPWTTFTSIATTGYNALVALPSVDVTGLVQAWLAAPASNHGIVLTQSGKFTQLSSSELSAASHRPALLVSAAFTCDPGYADCNKDSSAAPCAVHDGCEVNLLNDPANCGACGNVCSAADGPPTCVSGACQSPPPPNQPEADDGGVAEGNGVIAEGNGAILVLQSGVDGYSGVQDVSITNQYAASWNSYNGRCEKSGAMLVGNGADLWNALIRFDGLSSVVPQGAVITKAELTLHATNWVGNPVIAGYYLMASWDPLSPSLGWLRRSSSAAWAAPGGLGAGADLVPNSSFAASLSPNGPQVLKVGLDPAIVQGWVTTPSTNQGVLLTVEANPIVTILSSEDPSPANRPLLRLSYQTGTVALTPLTRVDPEPRGAHCKWGGKATHQGLDFDGSGTLSDDEVQSTTYACDPAVFYVDPNGVDTWTWGTPQEGTPSKPFATIGFATRYIDDGGTVIVRPGTYHGTARPEGRFSQGVLIKSEVPYAAKLRNHAMVVFIIGTSGITMEGFDIAHEAAPGQSVGPLLVHVDWEARDIVLRNNIIHDSLNNDSLKINGGAGRVLVEQNLFYNAVVDQIRMDTVTDVIIQDNVFFQDFEGAGRTLTSAPGSFIQLADQDGGPSVKSRDVTIRRNVFLNWENSYGANFVQLGGDALPWHEASYVLVENNLMIGNNTTHQMRAPFGCKGAEYALFRNNTLVGDMHATAFLARLNQEPGGLTNDAILFYNNVIANTAGTMARLTTTPWNDTGTFALDNNLYWNNGQAVPNSALELINPSDDQHAVMGDPKLASQADLVLPRWLEAPGEFADGSKTIAEVHRRLAWTYGRPDPQSAVVDAANPSQAPDHDIFRHPRAGGAPDLGAVEVEALAAAVDPAFHDGSSDFSGAGWDPAAFGIPELTDHPVALDYPTSRPAWYDTADNSPKPGQLFAPGNPWNVDASSAPLDPDSDQVIASLAQKGFGFKRLQVDFSLRVLQADATPYQMFTPTADFFSPDCDHVAVPVPLGGSLESENGYGCTGNGDCHLLVLDPSKNLLYEMWRANITADNTFFGGCLAVWDTAKVYGLTGRGNQCTSADAGGFPISAMLFTADEVAAGQINHAIRFILPNDRIRAGEYVYPATHGTPAASGGRFDVPYGGRLRLRANYPVSQLNPGAQVVARAMQQYGMILSDGGTVALTAADDRSSVHKWNGLLGALDLMAIQPSDFELVDGGTPIRLTLDCQRAP